MRLSDLVDRLTNQDGSERVVIGVAGAPGAGKTTLAESLVAGLDSAVHVPMDGFHLANAQLDALHRRARKGAPDTFDVAGFVALLRRIRADRSAVIYAPAFDRTLDEPVAGSIAVEPTTRVVVVEGNYLLLQEPGWREVRELLSECWYLAPPPSIRTERLVRRHEQFGRNHAAAVDWVQNVDQPNTRLVDATASRSDLVITELTL